MGKIFENKKMLIFISYNFLTLIKSRPDNAEMLKNEHNFAEYIFLLT